MNQREQIIGEMQRLLEFIKKGDQLTTIEAKHGHAHQVVGYAEGTAKQVLVLLGEKP